MGSWKELPFLDEWDEEVNGPLPDFDGSSSTRVQWRCRKDSRHYWHTTTQARKINGSGCPVCLNQKIIPGVNDLLTSDPDLDFSLDEELSGFSAREVSRGNNKKIGHWHCPKHPGHLAITTVWQVVNSGCPVCSGRQIITGFNDLKTLQPDLMKEWHPTKNAGLDPEKLAAGTGKKIWWVCIKDPSHAWQASGDARVGRGSGCLYCTKQKVKVGQTDLLTMDPELATYWDDEKNELPASEVLFGSAKKRYWWRCIDGLNHSFKASIPLLVNDRKCLICSGSQFLSGFNDLASRNPELAKEWHPTRNLPVLSSEIFATTDKKFWWKCSKDARHEWLAMVRPRHIRGIGCPICGNDWVLEGVNDFATARPDLLQIWDFALNTEISPKSVTKRSKKKVWWKCLESSNHVYKASVYSKDDGKGCLYCTGQLVETGVNDLATKFPAIAAEWNFQRNGSVEPKDVFARSSRSFWWRCSEYFDHEWRGSVSNRTRSRSTGCPYCGNKLLLTGFNDLQTLRPDVAEFWNYEKNIKTPSEVLAGTHARYWWVCKEYPLHVWNVPVVNLVWGTRCPACSDAGFDQTSEAILYFIKHEGLLAKKVGITNPGKERSRLEAFIAEGWEVISVKGPMPGSQILDIETRLLRWIRLELQLPPFLDASQTKKNGGWSETFSAEAVSNDVVLEKIEELVSSL